MQSNRIYEFERNQSSSMHENKHLALRTISEICEWCDAISIAFVIYKFTNVPCQFRAHTNESVRKHAAFSPLNGWLLLYLSPNGFISEHWTLQRGRVSIHLYILWWNYQIEIDVPIAIINRVHNSIICGCRRGDHCLTMTRWKNGQIKYADR